MITTAGSVNAFMADIVNPMKSRNISHFVEKRNSVKNPTGLVGSRPSAMGISKEDLDIDESSRSMMELKWRIRNEITQKEKKNLL